MLTLPLYLWHIQTAFFIICCCMSVGIFLILSVEQCVHKRFVLTVSSRNCKWVWNSSCICNLWDWKRVDVSPHFETPMYFFQRRWLGQHVFYSFMGPGRHWLAIIFCPNLAARGQLRVNYIAVALETHVGQTGQGRQILFPKGHAFTVMR